MENMATLFDNLVILAVLLVLAFLVAVMAGAGLVFGALWAYRRGDKLAVLHVYQHDKPVPVALSWADEGKGFAQPESVQEVDG